MRVLYDHQMFSIQTFGGITRTFIELMQELSQYPECEIDWYRGWHLDKYDVSRIKPQLHRYWGVSRGVNIPKEYYDYLNKISWQAFIWSAGKSYDIYHPSYYDDSWWQIAKPKRLVVTVHDMILEKFLGNLTRFQSMVEGKKRLIHKADLIFVVSKNTARDLQEIYDVNPSKIKLIYWGSRIQEYPGIDLPNVAKGKPYFLYVGTRSKYKNFETLVKVMSTPWLKDNMNVICFGGTSNFTPPELELMTNYGVKDRFTYLLGDDNLLKTLYENAQALVYPSKYEGFGLPPLEAMICKCPVICCNTSSLPEVVGDAALFFAPEDVEELNSCMKVVVGDEQTRQMMIKKGEERSRLFSWEKTAQVTLDGYKEII